jgi:catechol 2,3-dioxygenase-like lactoylglutathione lyase family enzyme
MVEIRGLERVHLVVGDLERSLCFYREAFGLLEGLRVAPRTAFLHVPGSEDVVVLHESERPTVEHFRMPVTDPSYLEDAIEAVVRAGGSLLLRGKHTPDTPYAYVADPDGNQIEL